MGVPLHDHPEIDELLELIDEVLEECPEPTTSDPSTGTPSDPPESRRAGAVEHGRKKSKRHSDVVQAGPSEWGAVAS